MNDELLKEWQRVVGNKNFFVYGAGKTAERVYEELTKYGLQNRLTGFVVTDKSQNPEAVCGKQVYQIDEITDKTLLILVPHVGVYARQIAQTLDSMGFLNWVNIADIREKEKVVPVAENPFAAVGMEHYYEKAPEELRKDERIRAHVKELLTAGKPDFGGLEPYQSLELIGLHGKRPSTYRIHRYQMAKYLKTTYDVLDIGCNTAFLDITVAPSVKSVTGVEYDASLTEVGKYVCEELNCRNVSIQNMDFDTWYSGNSSKSFDAVFSFAIHHWLNLSAEEYADRLNILLKQDGYLWLESHGEGGDPEYFDLIHLLSDKGYSTLLDEQIADDGRKDDIETCRRFVLLQKPPKE